MNTRLFSRQLAVCLAACASLGFHCGDEGPGGRTSDTGSEDVGADAPDADALADARDLSGDAPDPGDADPDTPPDANGDVTADGSDPDVNENDATDATEPDPIEALGAPGPYRVGYRFVRSSYERPDGGGERPLRLAVWYPSLQESGPAPLYFGLFPRRQVMEDAAPAPLSELPVLVYSHGHYGYAEASADLVEHFASHGWLVVAPDHHGNTLADNGTPRTSETYYLRADDVSAALDWVEALAAPDPLAGLASDRVVASGHSFGGFTTLLLLGAAFDTARLGGCESDPSPSDEFCSTFSDSVRAELEASHRDSRILGGIAMAAGNFGELGAEGVSAVAAPVLQMTGGMDMDVRNESNGDPIFAALPEGTIRVDLPRGCHQTFAVGCGFPGELETSEGFRIVDTYALAFARTLIGEGAGLEGVLDGTVSVSSEAVLTVK